MNTKLVKQWFKYAVADLKLAKNSVSFNAELKALSAFHSQQCAEKAMKGYLTFYKVRFPKTHDLGALIDLIEEFDKTLAKKLRKSEAIVDYAVTYRYPDAERKPLTLAKTKSAIKIAEMVFDLCHAKVNKSTK